ncbi:formate dehydrogenase subunit delta [Limimaricola variabilis]|jgi:formate dehydrogenase subunit delta|uniref:formate dehydrogenase subunit delta n=1 Tax=Limimaricola variabilis TaxID=1492771 RepID=UPI002AC9E261|nr:formate dehydrogenase subunit delta [Limimaricola variabilis]WPY94513.1 formate dehydrogenase subunit delta [Limimaricola variabilis]
MSSRTTGEKLVYMANQIATFFESQAEGTRAERVAEHLRSFWEPRMRDKLFAMMDNGEADGLTPLARRGAEIWREFGKAVPAHSEEE